MDSAEKDRAIPAEVMRPPRGLAHDLLETGCSGFRGGEHTAACNKLTQAFIDYGRWRERKGKELVYQRAMREAAEEVWAVKDRQPVVSGEVKDICVAIHAAIIQRAEVK